MRSPLPSGTLREFSFRAIFSMPKPKTPATVYGTRLRHARMGMGWTQAELAERIGMVDSVSGATRVSRYETGQHDPDPATAEALARALNLPVAYFHATSDVLADIILIVSRLPVAKQKEALKRLREIADSTGVGG
ncbi:helix-turn-helix domain-containing protein [Xanthomonas campestris pv. passiflorae]|uniref:helix-turn-helix domain-containing protein n=2 Tax=Xanthomonas TaxID=338 RepID=UPI001FBB4CC9|nr:MULTISPECIES: helix-turn-helix transcriptional regulator [Xanthomonas]NIK20086.1 transcriptional regulator with XRE-family HTH domain [Xanthomonas cannabis]USJ00832.1 helix-turn-helix domain-containing protein [Xanthomonas prunicola]